MAIEIRNEKGQIADLYPETTLSVERYISLFSDDDQLFQDITYPMTLPYTEPNHQFFGGGHLVDASNNLYRLSIQLIVEGTSFFAGSLEYKMTDNDYEVLMLVNFADIRNKIKETLLSDLYTNEPQVTITPALMYDTCLHPEKYNYAFFPVYNEYYAAIQRQQYPFTNSWNHNLQNFEWDNFIDSGSGNGPDNTTTRQSTFYKLVYLIKKVCFCLGYEAEGSFFDDPESHHIYIFSDLDRNLIVPASHLAVPPNLSIEAFFKILKLRFRVSLHFDALKGKVVVNSANSLLRSSEVIDISAYISKVKKIYTPEAQGFTVKLKADQTDALFLDPANEGKYIPTNQMIVGNGEKPIEIDATTLKLGTNVNGYSYPRVSKKISSYWRYENTSQMLRFLYFKGFKNVAGGKLFPEALPMELGNNDAEWYRFLNDSKVIELIAEIPPVVLSKIDFTKKIAFFVDDGTYIEAVGEFLKYDLENENEDLIKCQIKCWSVNFMPLTPIVFAPVVNNTEGNYESYYIAKALFDETELSDIKVEIKYPAGIRYGSYGEVLQHDKIVSGTISKSSDKFRVGGTTVYLEYLPVVSNDYYLIEFRCYQKADKLIYFNYEHQLTHHPDGYWYCVDLKMYTPPYTGTDARIFWLIF